MDGHALIKIHVLNSHAGASSYSVLNYFSEKFAEALREEGAEVEHYIIGNLPDNYTHPDLTVGFFPPNTAVNDLYFFDILKIPHVWFTVDAVEHFSHIKSPFLTTSTRDDKSYGTLLKLGHKDPLLLYHAADKEIDYDDQDERPYPITLLGSTLKSHYAEEYLKALTPALKNIVKETKRRTFENPHLTYSEAFILACQSSTEFSLRDLKKTNLTYVLNTIELILRHDDRMALITSIKNIPIHIFGGIESEKEVWSSLLQNQTNLIFHEKVDFVDAIEVMKKSKILINSIPTINYGGHERLFYALMAGALPLTTASPFIEHNFKDQESVLTYKPLEWDKAEAKIQYYLDNEPARKEVVERGRKIVLENHTWNHRARTLLNSPIVQKIIKERNK